MRAFMVLPMVPLEILPMVPLVANGTIGLPLLPNGTIGRANGTICITIGTNGITNGTIGRTNGTIGRTLNDIGIPLVPLVEPWTHAIVTSWLESHEYESARTKTTSANTNSTLISLLQEQLSIGHLSLF